MSVLSDEYMAMEIAFSNTKQWMIRAFCYVMGLVTATILFLLVN